MNREYRHLWQLISIVYAVAAVSIGVATTVYFAVSSNSASHAEFHEIFFGSLYALGAAATAYLAWHACQGAAASAQEAPHRGEGFNVYMRIGLAVFLAGSLALNLLRCTAVALAVSASCSSRIAGIVMSLLEMVFTTSQTAFILLHHRAVFLRRKAQNRIALAHLFVANICIWARTAIGEIKEQFERKPHHAASGNDSSEACSEAAATASRLLESVQPFLIPAVIEYCLLCAPMVLHLMACVGDHRSFALQHQHNEPVGDSSSSRSNFLRRRFAKSRRGLAFSLAAFIVTVANTVVIYALLNGVAATAVYLAQELLLSIVGSVLCLIVHQRLRRLELAKYERHTFDDKLLTFALLGSLVFQVTQASVLLDHTDTFPASILAAELTGLASCFLQLVLQTVCLLDGLRRRASFCPAALEKSGRGHVMALLGVNLSMWIIDTFEVRKAEELLFSYPLGNVSPAALKILVHIGQPISIFYRFHSTVCLSIIWCKAYEIQSLEDGAG